MSGETPVEPARYEPGMDARSTRMAERLNGPLLVAAALTLPSVVISESQPGGLLEDFANLLNWITWRRSRSSWSRCWPSCLTGARGCATIRSDWHRLPDAARPASRPAGATRFAPAAPAVAAAPRTALARGLLAAGAPLRGAARRANRRRRRSPLRRPRASEPAPRRLGRHLLGGDDDDHARLRHLPDHHRGRDRLCGHS